MGGGVGVGGAVVMVMKREREIVYYYRWDPHEHILRAMTRRRVAKQAFKWQRHEHSNGQTSLTVRPRYFLNILVTLSADMSLLLVQGAQCFWVVTWRVD